MRRIAVHRLLMADGHTAMDMAVVEIEEGSVVRWYQLQGEQPMTEWVGGEARLQHDDKGNIILLNNDKILC